MNKISDMDTQKELLLQPGMETTVSNSSVIPIAPIASGQKTVTKKGVSNKQVRGVSKDPVTIDQYVDWMQMWEVSEGDRAGERFEVLPWQRKLLADILDPSVKTIALSCGRAQGKTYLIAMIAASFVFRESPLMRRRGSCVIVASSFKQARVTFEHLLYLIPGNHRSMYRIQDSVNIAKITNKNTGATVQVLGSDPQRLHGQAISLGILDEASQFKHTQRDQLFEVMSTSLGKQPGGKLVCLGTRPYEPDHFFSRMLDMKGMADRVHYYTAPQDCDPFLEENWYLANPSLGHFNELMEVIRLEAERAKLDSNALATFRRLRLNQPVVSGIVETLIDPQSLARVETHDLPDKTDTMVLGVDIGGNRASSALVAAWWGGDLIRVEYLAAFPGVPDLVERGRQMHLEDRLVKMADDGDLLTCGDSKVIDLGMLLQIGYERFGQFPDLIVADRYKKNELEAGLKQAQYPLVPAIYRSQHYRDASEDVSVAKRLILDKQVRLKPSFLMRHCMGGAVCVADSQGNMKLAKRSEGGRSDRHFDDVVAALILALAQGNRAYGLNLDKKPGKRTWRARFV